MPARPHLINLDNGLNIYHPSGYTILQASVQQPDPAEGNPHKTQTQQELSALIWILTVLVIFIGAMMILSVIRWGRRRRNNAADKPMPRLGVQESPWSAAGRRAKPIDVSTGTADHDAGTSHDTTDDHDNRA